MNVDFTGDDSGCSIVSYVLRSHEQEKKSGQKDNNVCEDRHCCREQAALLSSAAVSASTGYNKVDKIHMFCFCFWL